MLSQKQSETFKRIDCDVLTCLFLEVKECAVEALKGKNFDKIARTNVEKERLAKKIVLDLVKDAEKVKTGDVHKISRRNQKKYVDLAKCTVNVKKDQDYHHKAPLPTEVGSWQEALDTIGESQS